MWKILKIPLKKKKNLLELIKKLRTKLLATKSTHKCQLCLYTLTINKLKSK